MTQRKQQILAVIVAFIAGAALASTAFLWKGLVNPSYSITQKTAEKENKPTTWFSQKSTPPRQVPALPPAPDTDTFFDHFFKDDFPGGDPFAEMRKMQREMLKQFSQGGNTRDAFESAEISSREDDNFLYYEIRSKNLDTNSLKVKVEEGAVAISGEMKREQNSNDKNSQSRSVFVSHFQQTIPLPENVDATKMQMDTQQDAVILKFPKRRA